MRSIRGADGLRALACLMVIFHHLCQRLAFQTLSPDFKPWSRSCSRDFRE